MQRRIFMSSPELFISRARAKRYRAGRGRRGLRGGDGGEGKRRGNGQPARARQDEEEDVGERQGGGERGRQGRLKRGMKRQTAADEIHNLDPMRSLYLV